MLWPGVAATVWAQPLPELYRLALAADPALSGAQAQLRAAEERLVQARAAFGPTLSANFNDSKTRYREDRPAHEARPFAAKQFSVQLTQPLFRPVLLPALQSAEAQVEQAQNVLEQARFDSMQRLVEACFEVLKARDALAFSQAQRSSTEEQLALARRAFAVGTSPVTDVREAQAKADLVEAQLIAAQFDLDLRQQILAELVGRQVVGLIDRGLRGESLPALTESVVDWLDRALAQNPSVQQAQRGFDAAQAEFAHAPTADLNATYLRSDETGSFTSAFPRTGDSMQVGFNVTIPLFASGATQARVRESIAARDKAQSDIDAARRQVTLGVRQNFTAARSAASQARGLETAVVSNEIALRANRRGYEVGMKVNAQVLDSQTQLFEARRDLSKARYDAWLNFVRLAAVAGQLSESDLRRLEDLLVSQQP